MSRLLKVAEVAMVLGLSRSKTYELTKAKKLPVINIDGCVRVPEDKLREGIDKRLCKVE